jgi:hypothetical protein
MSPSTVFSRIHAQWALIKKAAVLQIPNFFSRREDFSSCQQCLRAQTSFNTEVTEMLRVLCVKA